MGCLAQCRSPLCGSPPAIAARAWR
jgi:hypothetical protein